MSRFGELVAASAFEESKRIVRYRAELAAERAYRNKIWIDKMLEMAERSMINRAGILERHLITMEKFIPFT